MERAIYAGLYELKTAEKDFPEMNLINPLVTSDFRLFREIFHLFELLSSSKAGLNFKRSFVDTAGANEILKGSSHFLRVANILIDVFLRWMERGILYLFFTAFPIPLFRFIFSFWWRRRNVIEFC